MLFASKESKSGRWVQGQRLWKEQMADFVKSSKVIWFHCASVGEFEQARPIIEALHGRADIQVVLTFFSPSGFELRKDYSSSDLVMYLPYDVPENVTRFLDRIQPDVAIFVKYELWFNYMRALRQRRIPMALICAHFGNRHWTVRWPGIILGKRLAWFDRIFAQNEATKTVLASVGITHVDAVGDTRVDRVVEVAKTPFGHAQLEAFSNSGEILVIGSNWPTDDEILIPTLKKFNHLKAIVAPHEMGGKQLGVWKQAFGDMLSTLSESERSGRVPERIIFIDRIGMLSSLYRLGQVAYIGGGFGAAVHNTLEAAVYGIPVIFGPNNARFQEIQDMKEMGAGLEIQSNIDLEATLSMLLQDVPLRSAVREAIRSYFERQKGASKVIQAWIQEAA